jgi:hypothetical protein
VAGEAPDQYFDHTGWRAAQPQQPALFELKDDHRPAAERTAAGRYQEPTLPGLMTEEKT